MTDHNSPLTIEQQQRKEAVESAKNLLSAYREAINPADMLTVAEWIYDPEADHKRGAHRMRQLFDKPPAHQPTPDVRHESEETP